MAKVSCDADADRTDNVDGLQWLIEISLRQMSLLEELATRKA